MSSPIKKGPGTYGPAAFHGEQKKPRGTWEVRPRFGFIELFYLVTGGHISLLEQRHHQFISFNPLIFNNVLSMGELIEGIKKNVKKNFRNSHRGCFIHHRRGGSFSDSKL
jgi:hypothetical protein